MDTFYYCALDENSKTCVQNRTFAKGTLIKRVYLLQKMQVQNCIISAMINMDINCF